MKRRAALAIALLALLPAIAFAQPAPEGRQYHPGAFDAIEISGAAAVRFTQGPEDQVFIEGDDEVQKSVTVEVAAPPESGKPGSNTVYIEVKALDDEKVSVREKTSFLMPR